MEVYTGDKTYMLNGINSYHLGMADRLQLQSHEVKLNSREADKGTSTVDILHREAVGSLEDALFKS